MDALRRAFFGVEEAINEPGTADRSVLQRIFDEADKDGSKTLSAAECAEVLEGHLGDPNYKFENLLAAEAKKEESDELDFEQFCRVYNQVGRSGHNQRPAT